MNHRTKAQFIILKGTLYQQLDDWSAASIKAVLVNRIIEGMGEGHFELESSLRDYHGYYNFKVGGLYCLTSITIHFRQQWEICSCIYSKCQSRKNIFLILAQLCMFLDPVKHCTLSLHFYTLETFKGLHILHVSSDVPVIMIHF